MEKCNYSNSNGKNVFIYKEHLMKIICKIIVLGILVIGSSSCSDSAQKADPDFKPKNTKISFSSGNSPIVFIDEAHNNFHTTNGRYKPFVQVLTSDGYTVKPSKEKFTLEYLNQAKILVIANALDKKRLDFTPHSVMHLTLKRLKPLNNGYPKAVLFYLSRITHLFQRYQRNYRLPLVSSLTMVMSITLHFILIIIA